jgi:hypothetical protein
MIYKQGVAGSEVPVDLTNYAVRMDIRTADTARTYVYTFNSEDITEIPSVDNTGSSDNEAVLGSDGSINIVVPRSLTLPGGTVANYITASNTNALIYDIFLRNKTTNKQNKILAGSISVNRSVTLWG